MEAYPARSNSRAGVLDAAVAVQAVPARSGQRRIVTLCVRRLHRDGPRWPRNIVSATVVP